MLLTNAQVSLVRYGPHILPVFERPALVSTLVHAHSRGFQVPVIWQVSEGAYSLVRSWSAFALSPEFFLLTTTGRRMLYLEADTTNSEASLAFTAKASDLTMEDASQAFLLIRRAARHWRRSTAHTKPFRTFRVVLGNPRQVERTASRSRTLRERLDKMNQADVIVDSQAPVVGEVLRWCAQACGRRSSSISDSSAGSARRAGSEGSEGSSDKTAGSGGDGSGSSCLPMQTIVFETDSPECFDALSRALQPFGYSVMDPAEAEALELSVHRAQPQPQPQPLQLPLQPARPAVKGAAKNGRDKHIVRLPRLVYCTTTAETINAVQSLIKPRQGRRGLIDASRCCALLDRAESVDRLEDAHDEAHNQHAELQAELLHGGQLEGGVAGGGSNAEASALPGVSGSGIHIICTAVLYDDLLRQVRVWARLGHSPAEIQNELDSRFRRVATVLETMAVGRKARGTSGNGVENDHSLLHR